MSLSGYIKKLEAVQRASKLYPKRAGVIALGFVKDRFRSRNWIGDRTETWRKQRYPLGSGTPGTKSGALRRSYRITRSNDTTVVIGTDKAQARALNEGLKIPVTDRMRKFFWAKHLEAKEAGKRKEMDFWRGMATTRKKYFQLPRYQHIGESQYLTRQIQRQMTADYARALKT